MYHHLHSLLRYTNSVLPRTTRLTALFSAHIHLTFVQERPIGFGIKNNLGSLFDFLIECIFVYLLHKTPFKLFREVYYFFSYSFLHCMLLALAWSKFPIELEKYLLTWFFVFFTYIRLEFRYGCQWLMVWNRPPFLRIFFWSRVLLLFNLVGWSPLTGSTFVFVRLNSTSFMTSHVTHTQRSLLG